MVESCYGFDSRSLYCNDMTKQSVVNIRKTQRPRTSPFPGAIRINDFLVVSAAAVVGCDIHVMDARQSVNWPRYIEDDDYFRGVEPQTIHS